MRRKSIWSIGYLALFCFITTSAAAASIEDITGTWDVYSKTKAKVNGLGSDSSEGNGEIVISAGDPGANSGSFVFHDPDGIHSYTGIFILSPDGKKLEMSLDAPGRQEFEAMLTEWLQGAALGKGLTLENIVFSFDSKGISISPVKISKKTNTPTNAKVSSKGIVSADVWEGLDFIGNKSRKFSFTSKLKF